MKCLQVSAKRGLRFATIIGVFAPLILLVLPVAHAAVPDIQRIEVDESFVTNRCGFPVVTAFRG